MNLKPIIFSALLSVTLASCCQAWALPPETPEQKTARMEWFSRAKLGIFIHWGIYSKGDTSESWAFHNGAISLEDYMNQRHAFTAEKYDPALWAQLIRESGARYTVITTKHHDGFALWDTKAGDVSAVKSSPAGRDLIAPFAEEVRKQGLRLGLYYSLIDWPRDDYPVLLREGPARYRIAEEPERWQHFLDFNFAQMRELNETWKPDLYWFDGDWEHSAEEWRAPELVAMLRESNPNVILNSRIQGYGDYATPELGVPVVRPESKWWETCMTMNNSWGFRTRDIYYKSPMTLLRMLVDCISLGGNLLLDIGPRADGTIPDEQIAILKEFGRWTGKHAEAVYDTRAGIPAGHVAGYTSLSLDGKTLYVYLPYRPNESVEVKGLKSPVKRVRVVGTDRELTWKRYNDISWSEVPGVYYIDVPDEVLDERITVLALDLEEPVRLYRGSGQIISFNE
ncbi:alpha-L-fucosidase [Alistipes sp.]|uniref:alpha-L-fucosidase n=1 Tax=Alistipes sp. TaxID=1872444 RepID=UPI0025BDAEFD|nr:alpha-L-fucosidase [Alistipes sp.]